MSENLVIEKNGKGKKWKKDDIQEMLTNILTQEQLDVKWVAFEDS